MPGFSRPGIHRHLALYAAGIAFMASIDVITSPDVGWVQWPALGWGIGVASHALGALRRGSVYDGAAGAVTSAAPPLIALPDDDAPAGLAAPRSESNAMVERAHALLRRERADG